MHPLTQAAHDFGILLLEFARVMGAFAVGTAIVYVLIWICTTREK